MPNILIEAVKEKLFKKERELREAYERETGHKIGELYFDFVTGDNKERAETGGQLFEYFLYKSLYGIKGHRRFVCNPYLPTKSGTTEVDVILIAATGIYVFECKHYTGNVYGKEEAKEWLYYIGKEKYKFYNPIRQNEGHIQALIQLTGLEREKFHSKVVFPDDITLKVTSTDSLAEVDERSRILMKVKDEIRSGEQILTDDEIEAVYERLQPYVRVPEEVKQEHIEQIKEQAMTCPRCGGKLVERNGKNGTFYGCSNFPKCRFTKNVSADN